MGTSFVNEDGTGPKARGGAIQYCLTRFSSLKPPMNKVVNPFKALALLETQHWLFFAVGFLGWTWDSFDYFTVPLTVEDLAKTFDKSNADITWGMTLVLMFRALGSTIFGIASDRYGRKWPFVIINLLFIVLELGTAFCQTYQQFLACRALFGVAMGGLYGNAAATALEDCPAEARGILSGILQQGWALGYLLATAFARAFVDTTKQGWRSLYWFAAGPPVLVIIFRLCLPETKVYREREVVRGIKGSAAATFLQEAKVGIKNHWLLLIYMVLLMAGFNFMSHGSQDLYPTMLENQFQLSSTQVTVTQVVANLGAIIGGTIIGWLSGMFGRRLSIIVMSVLGGALLYPYTYVSGEKIAAAAFFQQFCVQGAWGVVPIHLMELSPGSLRTFVVGTTYQLGNLASSASSTIEAQLGERFPLPANEDGTKRFQYGKVICIFMACVYVYTIILAFVGPEYQDREFDIAHDEDMAEAAHMDLGTLRAAQDGKRADMADAEHNEKTVDG
ncbi:MFS transporter, SHS family, lactate transporter [Geosmithia morbida]|uniref:MFS transporter, SHS family, lactate transporter n=1 Tax=Geosmithia morbida TaxID=1094350 RepID=A0A9P4YSJ8_9HYPO|nr:MFS transporter, SHS family, lactate transporter [Geosmithia morbida]KAF4120943.1 MFS transporter, SHS family, lactate transporter [Geosmithia morbida]